MNSSRPESAPPSLSEGRRGFVRTAFLGAAGLGLGASLFHSCGRVSRNPRIAVVGGGLAGLSCCRTLLRQGLSPVLYEASDRLGGRVHTKKVAHSGTTCELGGEFIDTGHIELIALCQELGLPLVDTWETYSDQLIRDTYWVRGTAYSEQQVLEAFRVIAPAIAADQLALGSGYDTPRARELDQLSLAAYLEGLDGEDWLKTVLDSAYLAEFGRDTGDQSALNFIDLIATDTVQGFRIFGDSDERFKVEGGNQRIVDALVATAELRVQTAHRLERIARVSSGYELSFASGRQEVADFVVLTLPFSLLREVEWKGIELTPEKRWAIDELGYGNNNKLILDFPTRLWREAVPARTGFLYSDTIHNGWDSGLMQRGNQGGSTYTCYFGGEGSLKAAKAYRSNRDGQLADLNQRLAEAFGYSADTAGATRLTAALWSDHPGSRGSYSCYRPGQWTTLAGWEVEPVDQRIFFAGEHCSTEFQGYMNGAVETGQQAAQRILTAAGR